MHENLRLIENAELVLADRVVRGWVAVENGAILEHGEGRAPERGLDLGGDYLIPGLVELHTDHLESHYVPRPKVRWNPLGAVLAYDAQIAASGITTVFDSLRAGSDLDGGGLGADLMDLGDALDEARTSGLFRAEHLTHLRCEVPSPDLMESIEEFSACHRISLMSLMDHTPGQRQFRDIDKYLIYYMGKTGKSLQEFTHQMDRRIAENGEHSARNRPRVIAFARQHNVPLASHDDTTLDEVANSVEEGVSLAEFPTTLEAALALRENGIAVMMGAPNIIRGGSHSGNLAALDLAEHDGLDILSSDYVPASLLMAAFALRNLAGTDLSAAVRKVTRAPALASGLNDRGEIAPGLRADLVQVTMASDIPVVRRVWREGERVV
ncbi:alpha-D-ribose 1-methylphosphonate 5-triphosphate diphosphatase [Terrihabitans sp. B22-R8]|uniref:alpha-D-ribose 1-methylphosphonate 5-triphosphate diphosphatase n=1 Tax=Terrihabitans sp. B22-R8 TaxID=3425128 RepID=UPI00403C4FA8